MTLEFGSPLFYILIVLLIGLIAFYFWNKKRQG
jgi:LPXTG-motif cell wall-anchored protein